MSSKTRFQLLIIIVSMPTWPFLLVGFIVGYIWAALNVGFFWGNSFIDKMFEREEHLFVENKS